MSMKPLALKQVLCLISMLLFGIIDAPPASANHWIRQSHYAEVNRVIEANKRFYNQVSLTEPDCCPAFRWSPDSSRVLFLDAIKDSKGWWAVKADGGDPYFESSNVNSESPTGRYSVTAIGSARDVEITDRWTEETSVLSSVASSISFSPDESQIAFTRRDPEAKLWDRMVSLNIANTDGSNRKAVLWAPITIVGWLPDGQTLLLQINTNSQIPSGLWKFDISNLSLSKLLEASHIHNIQISPNGGYLSYIRALEPDTTLAGLWIFNTRDHTTTKLGVSGSYAWHPTSTGLLVVPPRPPGIMSHQFWWADLRGNPPIPITDPMITHLQISNFEWVLAPDGRQVAYREAEFRSLRAIDLGFALDVLVPAPVISKPWNQHNHATITGYPSGW